MLSNSTISVLFLL